jgi:hypothetical protein
MAEAVRQVAGVRVRSSAMATMTETSQALSSTYRSVVQLDATGRATDVRLLDESWDSVTLPQVGAQLYYRATYAVTVEREVGEADPTFRLDLHLERAELTARSSHLRDNDELVVSVTSSREARVFLFSLADDSLTTLVPNDYIPAVVMTPGASAQVPAPTWRERGLHFRVTRDLSRPRREELLVGVAVTGSAPLPPRLGTTLDLQRWLVRVPAAQRAMAFVPYTVYAR